MKRRVVLASLVAFVSIAFADEVPVVNASPGYVPAKTGAGWQQEEMQSSPNDSGDRVSRLENQVQYLAKQVQDASQVQQTLQNLQGQVEEQQHTISNLKNQLKQMYSDLDQRIGGSSSTQASIAPTASAPATEPGSYKDAYNILRTRDYPNAIKAMQAYLLAHPDGQYVPNAHYWLGEMYLLTSKVDSAKAEFNIVIKDYTQNAKASDAMLKMGLISFGEGDKNVAKSTFKRLLKQYPHSSAASLAKEQLRMAS